MARVCGPNWRSSSLFELISSLFYLISSLTELISSLF